MKTPEDEAFDEIAKRQGGFQAKRAMAAAKLQDHNHMMLRTPEQRRESARKAHATRRANKAKLEAKKEYALVYTDELRAKIVSMETRIAELGRNEMMNIVSATLTDKVLLTADEIVKAALPWERAVGVYFLVQDKEVVYVGQSVNVYSRISHHRDKKFDKYAFVPCAAHMLDKLESLYIHVLRPKLNGDLTAEEKSAPIRLNELLKESP